MTDENTKQTESPLGTPSPMPPNLTDRRKSSLFGRRLTYGEYEIVENAKDMPVNSDCEEANVEENDIDKNEDAGVMPSTSSPSKCQHQDVSLGITVEEYMQKVKQEIASWKQMYKDRKLKKKIITKQLASKPPLTEQECLSLLSEEDQLFLKNAPDCAEFAERAANALEAGALALQRKSDAEQLCLRLIPSLEATVNCLTKAILESE